MEHENTVEKVREFNRFYLPAMKLLGDRYLASEYSVTEARIFFELYQNEGCSAAYIAAALRIDKSYLSRLLAAHEKNGDIQRLPSPEDGRAYRLYLTEKGKRRAEESIEQSNAEIGSLLRHLSQKERRQLSQALDTVMKLLKKGERTHEDRSV